MKVVGTNIGDAEVTCKPKSRQGEEKPREAPWRSKKTEAPWSRGQTKKSEEKLEEKASPEAPWSRGQTKKTQDKEGSRKRPPPQETDGDKGGDKRRQQHVQAEAKAAAPAKPEKTQKAEKAEKTQKAAPARPPAKDKPRGPPPANTPRGSAGKIPLPKQAPSAETAAPSPGRENAEAGQIPPPTQGPSAGVWGAEFAASERWPGCAVPAPPSAASLANAAFNASLAAADQVKSEQTGIPASAFEMLRRCRLKHALKAELMP